MGTRLARGGIDRKENVLVNPEPHLSKRLVHAVRFGN